MSCALLWEYTTFNQPIVEMRFVLRMVYDAIQKSRHLSHIFHQGLVTPTFAHKALALETFEVSAPPMQLEPAQERESNSKWL